MGRTNITADARTRYWLALLHAVLGLPLSLVSLFATGGTVAIARSNDGARIGVIKLDASECKTKCWSDATAATWRTELIVTHALVAFSAAVSLQATLVTNEFVQLHLLSDAFRTCARSIAVRLSHSFALLAAAALPISILVFVTSDGVKGQWGVVFALVSSIAELVACALVVRISFVDRHDSSVDKDDALEREHAARSAFEISLFGTVLSVDVPRQSVVLRRSMQPTRASTPPQTSGETVKTGEVTAAQQVQTAEAPRVQSVPTRIGNVHGHRRQLSDDSQQSSASKPAISRRQLTLPPYSIAEEPQSGPNRPLRQSTAPVEGVRSVTVPIRQSTTPAPATRPITSPPPVYERAQSVSVIRPPQTDAQRYAEHHKQTPASAARPPPRARSKVKTSDVSRPVRAPSTTIRPASRAAPSPPEPIVPSAEPPAPKRSGSTKTIANVAALLEAYGGIETEPRANDDALETLTSTARDRPAK